MSLSETSKTRRHQPPKHSVSSMGSPHSSPQGSRKVRDSSISKLPEGGASGRSNSDTLTRVSLTKESSSVTSLPGLRKTSNGSGRQACNGSYALIHIYFICIWLSASSLGISSSASRRLPDHPPPSTGGDSLTLPKRATISSHKMIPRAKMGRTLSRERKQEHRVEDGKNNWNVSQWIGRVVFLCYFLPFFFQMMKPRSRLFEGILISSTEKLPQNSSQSIFSMLKNHPPRQTDNCVGSYPKTNLYSESAKNEVNLPSAYLSGDCTRRQLLLSQTTTKTNQKVINCTMNTPQVVPQCCLALWHYTHPWSASYMSQPWKFQSCLHAVLFLANDMP